MNDIHAFSLGVYSLGSVVYSMYQAYKFIGSLHRPIPSPLTTMYTVAATTSHISLRVIRFIYVWGGLTLVIPFLFAVLIELYFLMPLHAYLGPSEPHVVHIIQDWTLGFFYARLAAHIIFSDRTSRPARAFAAIISDGYLNPNARIATRCFLLPAVTLFITAIVVPSAFALSMNKTLYSSTGQEIKSQVWRYSYPAVGLAVAAFWAGKEGVGVLRRWRMVVRDEVYLIGERLHNFGDRKATA
jgi:E3 ubiquitin-protein ligase MARCH6